MGAKQANEAILAAHRTFSEWREKTAHERAQMLQRWFELVVQNTEDLARLMTCEQGKPLSESRNEIRYAASFIEWFAEETKRVYGDVIPQPQRDQRLIVLKQPIGGFAPTTHKPE